MATIQIVKKQPCESYEVVQQWTGMSKNSGQYRTILKNAKREAKRLQAEYTKLLPIFWIVREHD